MKKKTLLVTGACGLIGSEVCVHFAKLGWTIIGIDSNARATFFGKQGDTQGSINRLCKEIKNFQFCPMDIREREAMLVVVKELRPDAIVHTAAQPSHDKAAAIPFEDFDTNAVGTFNMLEATRRLSLSIPFVHMSTNKVYGDAPNEIAMQELPTRWDYDDAKYEHGIAETFRIDQSKHSLFGASKVAADIAVQEYGRYFGMPTACLRGGCLTGPNHAGVELHGFLSYLIKCNIEQKEYNVYGYKGKQVRDNIHAHDVSCFIQAFLENPRCGEVYNIGGGKGNTCSVLEAFSMIENISGIPMKWKYVDEARIGDHICYYSDLRKMQQHYPQWNITIKLEDIFKDIYKRWKVQ